MTYEMRTSMLRLPRFSLRFAGSGKIEDMRFFMQTLYVYWYHKGFWGATVAAAITFLNTFVLLLVAIIFTMRFDWVTALKCGEAECAAHDLVSGVHAPHLFHRNFWGYLWGCVFVCATTGSCCYEAVRFLETYHLQSEMEEVAREAGVDTGFLTPWHRLRYRWRRGLDGRDGHQFIGLRRPDVVSLSTAGWGDFLEAVSAAVGRSGSIKFAAPSEPLDPLRALQALMQLENYLIAIHEADALQGSALRFVGSSVLTSLLASMFDAFRTVESRHKCIWAVRSTMVLYATLYGISYPFFCLYSVLKVMVKNAAQLKVNYWAMSQRTWTTEARWRFRLYNEVEHLHTSRLRTGNDVAARMVERLRVSNSVARLVRRVCSTCVLVTAILSFLNPGLLIGGSIGGLTLVWWLTLALMLYACVPEDDPREREYAYAADLEKLVDQLHFCAYEWYESADAFYEHITAYHFKNQLELVVTSLLERLSLPVLLLYSLYDGSVETLVDFVLQHSITVDGVGSIAAGSEWAASTLSSTGDQERELSDLDGKDTASSATLLGGAPATAASVTGAAHARVEKVQQSIASFAAVYPQWTLRHIDGLTGDAAVGNSNCGGASLCTFLRALNERVCTAVAVRDTTQTAAPADLMVSQDSFVPPFSARTDHHLPTPREDGEMAGLRDSGVTLFAACGTTAHEREQLFVSQVCSSRHTLQHSRIGPIPRDAHDYGTG